MKTTLLFLTLSVLLFSTAPEEDYIDPTGTYQLGKRRHPHKEVFAYSGSIIVESLSNEEIAVDFKIDAGAPSYNTGYFSDTLSYKDNHAVFTTADDPSCIITLDFSKNGVLVKQEAADFNFSCGFGQGVVVDDFFKKKRRKFFKRIFH